MVENNLQNFKRKSKKNMDRKGRFRTQPITFMEIQVSIRSYSDDMNVTDKVLILWEDVGLKHQTAFRNLISPNGFDPQRKKRCRELKSFLYLFVMRSLKEGS